MVDYIQERKNLYERIKDSAPILDGAERDLKYTCNDYNVFCPLMYPDICKGIDNGCLAKKVGLKPV
jgi:hypothetical protein